MARSRNRTLLVVALLVLSLGTVAARRLGYGVGGNTVVRCRDGHLSTTIWIPGVSLKAVRLGWWRLQRCPVGGHWTLVHPVRQADLADEERLAAAGRHDVNLF